MTPTESLFAYWYFHIPNLVLAAAIYTLIGRYILSIFFAPDSDKVIWRVFKTVSDPVVSPVRAITPRIVPDGLVVVFAIAWLFAARMVLLLTVFAAGARPTIAIGG
jgi:uncharacterized protein YggT (Ycf19 family)